MHDSKLIDEYNQDEQIQKNYASAMMIPSPIEIDGKNGMIEAIYITELEFLMIKVFFSEEKKWINYNLGKYSDILSTAKIHQNAKNSD